MNVDEAAKAALLEMDKLQGVTDRTKRGNILWAAAKILFATGQMDRHDIFGVLSKHKLMQYKIFGDFNTWLVGRARYEKFNLPKNRIPVEIPGVNAVYTAYQKWQSALATVDPFSPECITARNKYYEACCNHGLHILTEGKDIVIEHLSTTARAKYETLKAQHQDRTRPRISRRKIG